MRKLFNHLAWVMLALSVGCSSQEVARPLTTKTRSDQPQATSVPRPRTLAEARRRYGMGPDAGLKMTRQKGGPELAAYDAELAAAVQTRWYNLIEMRPPKVLEFQRGRVVLKFVLHADGRVSGLTVSQTGVGEALSLICQKAIEDPAPFNPWPEAMRREVGDDHRKIEFTFHYY